MSQDSSGVPTYQEPYVKLTIANIEFFSEGAGDANENVCELYADFIHQSDVIPAHYYDWDNPPGTGDQIAPWTSYHGYLLLTGYNPNTSCTNINDGFSFVLDEAAQSMSSVFHSMHFGISFGDLSPFFEEKYPEWYANWYQGDTDADGEDDNIQLWNARQDSYFSHFISVNHPAQNEAGYEFLGYDWNSATFFGVEDDGTTQTEPCFGDDASECFVFTDASTPGARYGLTMGDAYWYEDYPNLDFNLLGEGAPAIEVETEDGDSDGGDSDSNAGIAARPATIAAWSAATTGESGDDDTPESGGSESTTTHGL